jgi:hypothetical protein
MSPERYWSIGHGYSWELVSCARARAKEGGNVIPARRRKLSVGNKVKLIKEIEQKGGKQVGEIVMALTRCWLGKEICYLAVQWEDGTLSWVPEWMLEGELNREHAKEFKG